MKFKDEVLYGSLVIEDLLKSNLITKDHYDHVWEIFNDRGNSLTYTLLDLPEVLLNLEQDDCVKIINHLVDKEKLQSFHHTKIAI